MIILAFDVDGTLDCSNGPVPVSWLNQVHEARVASVVIVSPSGAYVGPLPRVSGNPQRKDNLVGARLLYGSSPMYCLYVSDNKDHTEAEAAGFLYVEAIDFARGIVR